MSRARPVGIATSLRATADRGLGVMRAAAKAWRRRPGRRRLILGLGVLGPAVVVLGAGAWHSSLDSPEPTVLLRDRQGAFLGEVADPAFGVDRGFGFWPLDRVPSRVALATTAVEDRRFDHHPGVDPVAVARAVVQNIGSGERVSGASTLAMQVARLQRPGSRTYGRKLIEASTALWLTARHGREGVLRQYLRLVPYGNQCHGIRYAARRYFDKPVVDLSWAEVAFLVAIPQSPARMNPYDPRGRARAVRRGLQILDLLLADGVLPALEHRLARRQITRLKIPPRAQRPEEALHAVLRLGDQAVGTSTPMIDTTLDLELQREVTALARKALEPWRRRGAGNVAVLVVDRGAHRDDAAVRAAVSSAGYFDRDGAGSIDYLQIPRSSGSTLKPFFFAQALDRGVLRPTTILDDLQRGAGGITNADNRFLGPLLPRFALGNSRNVPAANLLADIGLDAGWALLGDLGLATGWRSPERFGLGLTIGSLAVTLEDLVAAYTALADDGMVRSLRWLDAVESSPPRRVLSAMAARHVTRFLADPQARLPSFPRRGSTEYDFPVAVKTGTSSRYRDAWTIAWSGRYLVGVWVGHPDHRPMSGLSGYGSAATLAQAVMRHLHPDVAHGMADIGFPLPAGHREVAVCALSGRRAGPACDRVAAEALSHEAERALPECRVHRLAAVDRRSGLLADHRTPRPAIELRAFTELPARYADWQARVGLPRPPRPGRPSEVAFVGGGQPARLPVETRLTILSPEGDVHLLIDPETPANRSSVALAVEADPPPPQILWRVNGRPFALVDPPFRVRWPLEAGDHVVVAEDPRTGSRSAPVRIRVE